MSFWSSNPFVASWQDFVESWWKGFPPRLLQTGNLPRRAKAVLDVEVKRTTVREDLQAICELWSRGYSQSEKTRCRVPASLVERAVQEGKWEVWMAVHQRDGRILGTVVRRHLTNVRMLESQWARASVVDYFYVIPGWKEKGIGRLLLCALHNSAQIPMCPHLILWEGVQMRIPPLSSGVYWVRRREEVQAQKQLVVQVEEKDIEQGWAACCAFTKPLIRSASLAGALETTLWRLTLAGKDEYVAVWNTFHRSVPDNKGICVVIGCTAWDAVETFAAFGNGHSWDIVLASWQISEAWSFDSVFQWITYNCQTGSMDTRFPSLAL